VPAAAAAAAAVYLVQVACIPTTILRPLPPNTASLNFSSFCSCPWRPLLAALQGYCQQTKPQTAASTAWQYQQYNQQDNGQVWQYSWTAVQYLSRQLLGDSSWESDCQQQQWRRLGGRGSNGGCWQQLAPLGRVQFGSAVWGLCCPLVECSKRHM
jgi:hypothetical protein